MNKNLIVVLAAILIIGTAGLLYFNSSKKPQISNTNVSNKSESANSQNTSFSASFAIYTNGTFRTFTAPMYHNLSKDVFIDAQNPNIVQVKKENITWRDFFNTLPFELNETCLTTGTKQTFCTNDAYTLQFYINGVRNQSALNEVIKANDKLLVTYEPENSIEIENQLQSIPDPEGVSTDE